MWILGSSLLNIILRTIHNVTAVSTKPTMREAEIQVGNNNHLVVRI
jgi:hypothetical protein